MKRVLKIIGIVVLVLILVGLVFGWAAHEPLPEGQSGPQAEALADKMLQALNSQKYEETRYLQWSFQGGKNRYRWDKASGICTVWWKDYEVVLYLTDPDKSRVSQSGMAVIGKDKEQVVEKALASFNNDSFWLVAPYKIKDAGVERRIVLLEDGAEALLVTYTAGGTTPGDSYLWLLNENGFPRAYKMWVKILPIGGIEASWDDWLITESGAYLPKSHQLGPMLLSMGEVEGRK